MPSLADEDRGAQFVWTISSHACKHGPGDRVGFGGYGPALVISPRRWIVNEDVASFVAECKHPMS